MATDTLERPNVDEAYEVAINATSLRPPAIVGDGQAEPLVLGRSPVDLLIAAREAHALGMALRRLQGEWNSVAKPARLTHQQVAQLAARLKADDDRERKNRERENAELARLEAMQARGEAGFDTLVAIMEQRKLYEAKALPLPAFKPEVSPAVRAQAQADGWYLNELRLLAISLKSRKDVWRHLPAVAARAGLTEKQAADVLLHWLAPICRKCCGRKWQLVPGTPATSGKPCPAPKPGGGGGCGGTGEGELPYGEAGRKLANELDQFVHRARQGMLNRLRGKER